MFGLALISLVLCYSCKPSYNLKRKQKLLQKYNTNMLLVTPSMCKHTMTVPPLNLQYFQWVPLYLIFLSVIFYMPRCFWLMMEGGLMKFFGKGTTTRSVAQTLNLILYQLVFLPDSSRTRTKKERNQFNFSAETFIISK